MRTVAGKQNAVVAEPLHAQTGKRVNADPFQFKLGVLAKQGANARQYVFGALFYFRVGVPAELKIDAPDVVGLLVQQY